MHADLLGDVTLDYKGNPIPVSGDFIPGPCLACPKFDVERAACGKCGCASERLRPVEEILACPIKLFIRPRGWGGRKTPSEAP